MRLAALAAAVLFLAPTATAQAGACSGGTATLGGVSYGCSSVDLLATVGPVGSNGPFRSGALNDIWGWTDPDTGSEYALVGTRSGVVFVDVSEPAAPRVLGKMLTTRFDDNNFSTWRDVKVYQDHAFVVADAMQLPHGMQVLDLTTLRGLSEDPERDIEPTAVYEAVFDAHNIVINEDTGFAYAVGGRITPNTPGIPDDCNPAGFHAINIQDPTNPTFAGCFSDAAQETGPRTPGYTHDAQCVVYAGPDPDHQGAEICFGANEDVVSIFDVSDKDDVVLLSQTAYPQFSYTHQGWLTEDQRYFLANDELDELNFGVDQRTIVLDVQDLDEPGFAFAYDSGLTSSDHNLYIDGGTVYEANYESGLRLLDASDVANGTLTEVAFFDTYPQATQAGTSGAWSSYPYFESGIVVVSDTENGLFVVRPDPALFVSAEDAPAQGPALSAPAPNPTRGRAVLTLTADTAQTVSAALYDALGRRVAMLFEGAVAADAPQPLVVDGAALPAGVYVVRVEGETFSLSRSVTLAR